MNSSRRGPWFLFTGLLIGFVFGLAYTWVIQPKAAHQTSPDTLRSNFKDQYRVLTASAFTATGDLVRAKARLELLGDPDPEQAIIRQVNRSAGLISPGEERALRLLLAAIQQEK